MKVRIHAAASRENSNHKILITYLELESKYESNLPSEYKWMHEFTQQVEKKATIRIHISFVAILSKYKSNLLAEQKQMHEFTQQQVEKRATIHIHIFCCNVIQM